MRFEWDERRNEINFKKHKVWFEEAKESLQTDRRQRSFFDKKHSALEARFIALSLNDEGVVLSIVYTFNEEDFVTRLISVRKATKKERIVYYERRIRLL